MNTISAMNPLLDMKEDTDEHIKNVKVVYRSMRSIKNLIEKEGPETAFESIMGTVSRWEEVVREAADHVSPTLGKKETAELLKPSSLKELLERLEKHKLHTKFGL